jgi:hypothetical protein
MASPLFQSSIRYGFYSGPRGRKHVAVTPKPLTARGQQEPKGDPTRVERELSRSRGREARHESHGSYVQTASDALRSAVSSVNTSFMTLSLVLQGRRLRPFTPEGSRMQRVECEVPRLVATHRRGPLCQGADRDVHRLVRHQERGAGNDDVDAFLKPAVRSGRPAALCYAPGATSLATSGRVPSM